MCFWKHLNLHLFCYYFKYVCVILILLLFEPFPASGLQQRGYDFDYRAKSALRKGWVNHPVINFQTFRKCSIKVFFYFRDTTAAIHPDAILKMMDEASIVEIDGPDHGHCIIGQIEFCVDKPRCVFINFHSGIQKPLKITLRHFKYDFLVWNIGYNDFHKDASPSSIFNGLAQFIVNNQVGRHDIYIANRLGNYILDDTLSNPVLIDRAGAIPEGNHIPGFPESWTFGEVLA